MLKPLFQTPEQPVSLIHLQLGPYTGGTRCVDVFWDPSFRGVKDIDTQRGNPEGQCPTGLPRFVRGEVEEGGWSKVVEICFLMPFHSSKLKLPFFYKMSPGWKIYLSVELFIKWFIKINLEFFMLLDPYLFSLSGNISVLSSK